MPKTLVMRFPAETPVEVYSPENPPPSGGSDTPWTVDHDANGFSLNNVNILTVFGPAEFSNSVVVHGTNSLYIGEDALGGFNSPDGGGLELQVFANTDILLNSPIVWLQTGQSFSIGTITPRGIFDINNFIYTTVAPPASATATINYGSGDYFNDSYSSQFRIYSFKTTPGGDIYSSTYAQTLLVTDNGLMNDSYFIALVWDQVVDADGYEIVVYDDYNGYNFDGAYFVAGSATVTSDYMSTDFVTGGPELTPTSYHVGADLYVDTADGSLNLFGDLLINGAITQSNSSIENTITGPVKIIANHTFTGAGNDGIFWVTSNNSSISATFRLEGATNPKMLWGGTNNATNAKYVQIYIDGSGSFNWGNLNDALSVESNFMKFTRSGITPTGFIIDSNNAGTKSGFGVGSPTARIHVAAGSTSANTSPFKMNSGSLLTSPEAGAFEFLTDKIYFTITTGAARKEITLNDAALTSGRVPFATTNGRLTDDGDMTFATDTLTVTGLKVGTTKISSYNGITTVSNGVPSELATVDLTAQTAAKATTTLYTPTATGLFRISVYLQVTTAGSVSSVLGGTGGVVITYNDGDGNVAQTDTVALMTTAGAIAINAAGNTTATNLTGSIVIYARTGVAIQYAIGYTSAGTAMQYAAHLKLEAL